MYWLVRVGRFGSLLLLAGLCLILSTNARAASPEGARWAKSPAWVEDLPVDFATPVDPDRARRGTYALLRDVRVRLEPASVERYCRSVKKAVSQAGVEQLGELQIDYAPQFEHLLLHRAAVIRDGQVLDQTGHAALRLLESEDEQGHGVYSGRVTALLVLSDVRAGDVIDVAFSVVGYNPVMGERYAGHVRLGGETNVRRVHVEVSSATSRKALHWAVRGTAPLPTESARDGRRVLTWELEDVLAPPAEDRVPETFTRPAELSLSEFADWGEVARWASPLYSAAEDASVRAKALEFRAAAPDLESAVLAAIRFVQDDVRYLSLSLGPHSVKPHAPASVLSQRFGDCKDKSYLLVELLRALGVNAYPALADTELRRHLAQSLPSPFAFDHVITAIDFAGQRYYVDPTWAQQGGSLAQNAPPDLGAVLLVAPESAEITLLPAAPNPLDSPRSIVEDVTVGANGAASLRVTTTLTGADADEMRAKLAAKSTRDLSREFLNYYAQQFPAVTVTRPLEVNDRRAEDVMVILENYEIPKFWRDGARRLIPDQIWNYIEAPDVTQREAPLALRHPVWLKERIEVSLPFAADADNVDETYADDAAKLHRVVEFQGHRVSIAHEYRSLAETVSLDALPRHLEFLADARRNAGVELNEEPVSPSPGKSHSGSSAFAVLIAPLGVGLFALVGLVVKSARRRRRRSDERNSEPREPAVAESLQAARIAFTDEPCACGAAFSETDVQFTLVRLDGRVLHAARIDCSACEHRRRGYFCLPEGVCDA